MTNISVLNWVRKISTLLGESAGIVVYSLQNSHFHVFCNSVGGNRRYDSIFQFRIGLEKCQL